MYVSICQFWLFSVASFDSLSEHGSVSNSLIVFVFVSTSNSLHYLCLYLSPLPLSGMLYSPNAVAATPKWGYGDNGAANPTTPSQQALNPIFIVIGSGGGFIGGLIIIAGVVFFLKRRWQDEDDKHAAAGMKSKKPPATTLTYKAEEEEGKGEPELVKRRIDFSNTPVLRMNTRPGADVALNRPVGDNAAWESKGRPIYAKEDSRSHTVHQAQQLSPNVPRLRQPCRVCKAPVSNDEAAYRVNRGNWRDTGLCAPCSDALGLAAERALDSIEAAQGYREDKTTPVPRLRSPGAGVANGGRSGDGMMQGGDGGGRGRTVLPPIRGSDRRFEVL